MNEFHLHIIDFLCPDERNDSINLAGINELKSIREINNNTYYEANSAKELGSILSAIVDENENQQIIIHILCHGGELGIAKIDSKYLTEIIHWEILLEYFKKIKTKNVLIVNLISVCFSSHILKYSKDENFNQLYYCTDESQSIHTSKLIYDNKLNFDSFSSAIDNPIYKVKVNNKNT